MNGADSELQRRVLNFLMGRNVPELRAVEVTATAGAVTLRGRVHSYYQKQLCLSCAGRVAGVSRVVDQVDVASYDQPNSSSLRS